MTTGDKRWAWYGQVRDAALLLFGMGLLTFEAIVHGIWGRNSDPALVSAAVGCLIGAATGIGGRWAVKRIEEDDKK